MNKFTHPILSAIVAMAENRVIGKHNQLPWHLPADLKHFKALTTGHPILMGRKTYQSIGRPLPNRTNIILTRDKTFTATGCLVTTLIDEALASAAASHQDEIFIIGGAEIYKALMPRIQRIYLTIVHATIEGDAYFPELDKKNWAEISQEDHPADTENPYPYSFISLERINCSKY